MIKRIICWGAVLAGLLVPLVAQADPFQLSYSGRLINAKGQPLAGPVDIQLKLFRDDLAPGTLIPVTIPVFDDVVLSQGMFNVTLSLTAANYHTAFDGSDVWVEVKDVTNNKTYPRQRFMAVPYALKVPVDGVTVLYDADGRLRAVTGGTGNMNTGTYDTAGTVGIVDQAELALDAQQLEGEAAADFHDAAQLTGTVADGRLSATVTNLGDDISLATEVSGVLPVANLPVGTGVGTVAAGNDARFTNVTNLGADINLASEVTGVLPVANLPVGTTAAHVAAGNDPRLSDSRSPSGAAGGGLAGTYPNPTISSVPDAALSANVSKLGADISLTAEVSGVLPVANLPVGTTAAHVAAGNDARLSDSRPPSGAAGGDLSGTYPNPQIATGTIVNTDISGSAAIDTSKLSGALTSVAGHGLGTMAAQSAGAVNITGGTIAGVTQTNFASTGIDDNADALAMTINNSEYVGIGTSSPTQPLHVVGNGPQTAALFERAYNTDGNSVRTSVTLERNYTGGAGADGIGVALGFRTETETEGTFANVGAIRAVTTDATVGTVDSYLGFGATSNSVANTDQLVITGDGNVGIGTIAPTTMLDVLPAATNRVGVQVKGMAGQSANLQEWRSSGGTLPFWVQYDGYPYASDYRLSDNNRLLLNGTTTQVFANTGRAVTLTVATNDVVTAVGTSVGINDSTPSAALDVNGEVKVGSTAVACSATIAGSMRYDGTGNGIQSCVPVDGGNYTWRPVTGHITSNLTLTVADPSLTGGNDCALIQQKIDLLDAFTIARGVTVTVSLPNGTYNCSSTLYVEHPQGRRISILGNVATPANVELIFTDVTGLDIRGDGLQVNGLTITGAGTVPAIGIAAVSSKVSLGTKIVVKDFNEAGSTCLAGFQGGAILVENPDAANYLSVSNCYNGISVSNNSQFQGGYTRVAGASNSLGNGFYAGETSSINVPNSQCTTTGYCYVVSHGSSMIATSAAATQCTYCYLANISSVMYAGSASASNYLAGGVAFYSTHGSYLTADSANANGSAAANDFGYYATYDASIFAGSATSTNNHYGTYAASGSYIQVNGMTNTGSTTANTPAVNTTGTRREMNGN